MVKQGKILFICDKRRCAHCNPGCTHTSDIQHAKNFELFDDIYIEREKKSKLTRPIRRILKRLSGTGVGRLF